jgi:hypothetical protein
MTAVWGSGDGRRSSVWTCLTGAPGSDATGVAQGNAATADHPDLRDARKPAPYWVNRTPQPIPTRAGDRAGCRRQYYRESAGSQTGITGTVGKPEWTG